MRAGYFSLFLAPLLALCLTAASAFASEQPPDFQACIDRTENAKGAIVQAMLACQDESIRYWDNKLTANYRKAREICATASEPEEGRPKLQRAERLWIQYLDAMSETFDQGSPGMGLGAMPSRSAVRRTTQHQAEELDFFIRQGEELRETN